jgi:hypothetical protein
MIAKESTSSTGRQVDLYTACVGKDYDRTLSVWQDYTNKTRLCVYELGTGRRDEDDCFFVPPELLASFQAGEPIEPILDWVLERYGSEQPWLEECIRKLMGGKHAGV